MKKYFSVLELYMRSSLYKILLICFGMGAFEAGVFYLMLHRQNEFVQFGSFIEIARSARRGGQSFSLFYLIFGIAFILAFTVCIGMGGSSKYSYTILRLKVSERAVFVLQCLSNAVMFTIIFLWQIVLMTAFAYLFDLHWAGAGGPQGIAADFYRNSFLHGLFPLQDGWLWFRNAVYIAFCAVFDAMADLTSRYGQKYTPVFIGTYLGILVIARIRSSLSYTDSMWFSWLLLTAAAVIFVYAVFRAHNGRGRTPDFEEKH